MVAGTALDSTLEYAAIRPESNWVNANTPLKA
jgi:hypothetical protein